MAAIWDYRKGLEEFIKLNQMLDPSYQIVLVGLSGKQIEVLPENIIGITRTNSVDELREIYAVADWFVNPTFEDNYPTTNLEAIACGTPVISYDTGGSGESAVMYGYVCKKSVHKLKKYIDEEYVDIKKDKTLTNDPIDKFNMLLKYYRKY